MKLPRPYIPLSVRIKVARRQLMQKGWTKAKLDNHKRKNKQSYLDNLLTLLFDPSQPIIVHMDHDPPLMLRDIIKTRDGTIRYMPDANDPEYLIYRKADDHKIKTLVRGDGAQRSDFAQRRYLKRVAENRKQKKKFKPRRPKQIRRLRNV
jgi:hypothetical protein